MGWFFGILFILFGLLLVFGNPIVGLIVIFTGVLICYGGSRLGRSVTSYVSSGVSNKQRIEEERRKKEERRRRANQLWWNYWWNDFVDNSWWKDRRRDHGQLGFF